MRKHLGWAIVATGEGAGCDITRDVEPHEAAHRALCFCGKPWRECGTDDIRAAVAKIDDPENWMNDEGGNKFTMELLDHECGKVNIYSITNEVA